MMEEAVTEARTAAASTDDRGAWTKVADVASFVEAVKK